MLKTWGVPLAAMTTLLVGEDWENRKHTLDALLRAVAEDQTTDADGGATDMQKAYDALLGAVIETEVLEIGKDELARAQRVKRTVYDVFKSAHKANPRAPDNASGIALKQHGMTRVDSPDGPPRLFVSDCAQLRAALKGTPWASGQSIVDTLARLPGAQRTALKPKDTRPFFSGARHAGVFIPVAMDEDAGN
jgi:hypothetical protein